MIEDLHLVRASSGRGLNGDRLCSRAIGARRQRRERDEGAAGIEPELTRAAAPNPLTLTVTVLPAVTDVAESAMLGLSRNRAAKRDEPEMTST